MSKKSIHNDNFHQAILVEDIDDAGEPVVPTGKTTGTKTGIHTHEVSSNDVEGGGKSSVGTTRVEATFTGETRSIIITADTANTGTLYVGKSDVTNTGVNAITFLSAGEHIVIDYEDSSNALYVVASASSQNFWKGSIL